MMKKYHSEYNQRDFLLQEIDNNSRHREANHRNLENVNSNFSFSTPRTQINENKKSHEDNDSTHFVQNTFELMVTSNIIP